MKQERVVPSRDPGFPGDVPPENFLSPVFLALLAAGAAAFSRLAATLPAGGAPSSLPASRVIGLAFVCNVAALLATLWVFLLGIASLVYWRVRPRTKETPRPRAARLSLLPLPLFLALHLVLSPWLPGTVARYRELLPFVPALLWKAPPGPPGTEIPDPAGPVPAGHDCRTVEPKRGSE